ncbi:MAG: DUF3592 domain-containing protein [Lachnospiraceae bacterium]|nr:DUF3592 domain-containing protein [Lachnospiraceae bacterium]
MDRTLWTASLFLVITGFLFLTAAAIGRVYFHYREPRKGRATARVVDLILREPENPEQARLYKNYYYPVLEFYADGKLYKIVHSEGSYPTVYHMHQELRLYYNKENPEDYVIVKNASWDILTEIFSVLGVICIFAACILFAMFAARQR